MMLEATVLCDIDELIKYGEVIGVCIKTQSDIGTILIDHLDLSLAEEHREVQKLCQDVCEIENLHLRLEENEPLFIYHYKDLYTKELYAEDMLWRIKR